MSPETLHEELEDAALRLLTTAKEMTWSTISPNCKFILSEIKNTEKNFFEQRQAEKMENDKKTPLLLEELMPALLNLYENFYDINLYIYKATKKETIVDIRYYPKSSLDEDYRKKIIDNPPMLHCKIPLPPWQMDEKKNFDINWQHQTFLNNWKLFWAKQRLKLKGLYREL